MRVVRAALFSAGLVCALLAPGAAAAGAGPEVRLAVQREAVRAGGTQGVRIENDSSHGVGYGRPYELSRWSRGKDRWVRVPVNRLFSSDLLGVDPGAVGPWQPVEIGTAPGRYRVRKWYTLYVQGLPGEQRTLSATFQVTAPPPG